MAPRKRQRRLLSAFRRTTQRDATRQARRRHLLETLEPRQLLAGPQLIGVQPNQGDLIDEGIVRSVAPRTLTFRFDESQTIDLATAEGIRITRSGGDGVFGTAQDVMIRPAAVSLGDTQSNEVIVRFADALPDDRYRIEVFAFDDPTVGVTALRNTEGEIFQPRQAGAQSETIDFRLALGAQVEAVVPQPVVREADGTLQQRRNEILVYFNEDELFVENDANGNPTPRSAENPRFYQLLLTQDTVSTADDTLYHPDRVIYDPATHTARLIFATDINELAEVTLPSGEQLRGVPIGGGTFRLRIGSAVDSRDDLIITPAMLLPGGTVGDTVDTAFDLNAGQGSVQFVTDGSITSSILVPGEIQPVAFPIQLPGGANDPGRALVEEIVGGGLRQTINANFGPDSTPGVTEVLYNFQTVYATSGSTSFVNQITDRQKRRVREAVSLWSNYLGIQFRETVDQGITFAVGEPNRLPALGLQVSTPAVRNVLNAALRIDPTFTQSAMVLSNETQFNTAYGEDFFRKTMAGIGFLIGLEQSDELTTQSLMSLSALFLNQTINPTLSSGATNLTQLRDLEPSFPGNLDILHGRHVHRPDSIDVDLYRFEVDLGPDARSGQFTAELFAERLPDSSSLDGALRLFRDDRAAIVTDLGVGSAVSIKVTSQRPGGLGNNTRIDFVRSFGGDIEVRQTLDSEGNPIANGIEVLLPLSTPLELGDLLDEINNHPIASGLMRAELLVGSRDQDISAGNFSNPLLLRGGELVELARNDDYFSNDSLLTASLPNGVYYIGVASSGNDRYDPQATASGYGGRTQGAYELALKFEPLLGQVDTIRDRDNPRQGVPGTALDGNGDGLPGGAKNFWFQTRPLDRLLEVTANGLAINPGQTFTLVGSNGQSRRFEFVPQGSLPAAGNVAVFYNPTDATTPTLIATAIRNAINVPTVRNALGITAFSLSAERPDVIRLEGERSVRLGQEFRGMTVHGRTVFVDKLGGFNSDGSLSQPFNNIANPAVPNAFGAVSPGDIVRIVGNGGQDGDLGTPEDNFAYKVGTTETGGGTLEDGRNLLVPRGVKVMIDAGAAIKLRNAAIVVGSTGLVNDRSGGVLQVLGTPRLVELSDPVLAGTTVVDVGVNLAGASGSVILTSTRDRSVDVAAAGNSPSPSPGNWGGIIFRRDFDQTQGRPDLEDEGIFLQTVNHADIRFGGGSNVLIESVQQSVNPIQMINLRPNITYNRLTSNAGAAMSASPDSFEETSFQAPRFQQDLPFTADYSRVGPDIRNNFLASNSINGLFVRAETTPNQPARQLTVAGRFDNIDIVHYIAENLIIAGNPGGSIQDGVRPLLSDVSGVAIPGSGTLSAGDYAYQLTFVDRFGFESLAAIDATASIDLAANGSIELFNLPTVPSGGQYLTRRLYRLAPGETEYRLAAELDATRSRFLDSGQRAGVALDLARQGIRGRLNASLVVDPGTVVKLVGSRIELGHGSQLIAEGVEGLPVVFTSIADDRYGAGGSFDTNNSGNLPNPVTPARGNWAGIYGGPTSHISIDHAIIAYGGGLSLVEGGQTKAFNALELQQATARVTNTRFEFNANGQGGAGPVGRNGRLGNTPATIFARFTQPILVGNEFLENRGPVIDIDSDSLTAERVVDLGRQSGALDRLADLDDNFGPLIRRNAMQSTPSDSAAQRQLNGMYVRGGVLSTSSIWDDTDIVHMVFDSIVVGNQVSGGELRLQSRPDESLVIKLSGSGNPNGFTTGTGFTATGSAANLTDRIGGTIQVVGLPGAPVVMTSLADDTVGAGRQLDGRAQNDTNGDGFGSRPFPNDWRGLVFDEFSNDRNVAVVLEQELATEVAPGLNSSVENAQVLGELAENFYSGDENFRLGFEVHGFLSGVNDVDVYSFSGVAGTPVWFDIDKTSIGLDTVLEILDSNGNVLAQSSNGFAEADAPSLINVFGPDLQGRVGPLSRFDGAFAERGAFGLYEDFGSTNPRDAGFSVVLPGSTGGRGVYYVRVRSASVNPNDAAGGLSRGGYMLQVRLAEQQEFPGSTVQFADIRYANHGVRLRGLPNNSPLIGEIGEDEATSFAINNNSLTPSAFSNYGTRPQYVGNLASTRNDAISIAGTLSAGSDIDFFRLDVAFDGGAAFSQLQKSAVFDIDYADGFSRVGTTISVFYDDGTGPRLVLVGSGSNIADDQASPLETEIGELLRRGSGGNADPFIGPVSLPQGTYFIAVTADGVQPQQLVTNSLVRREPLESVLRIFDDSVESIGTFGTSPSVMPREGAFVDSIDPGWAVTTERGGNQGHQRLATFNGSRAAEAVNPGTTVFASEPNNTFAQAVNLELFNWNLGFNPNVGSTTANTSEIIPWITANGSMANDFVDIFRFEVPNDAAQVYLDIDNGFNPSDPTGPGSVDLKLQLFREVIDPDTFAVSYQLVSSNSNANPAFGAGGSQPGLPGNLNSTLSADPFIQATLQQGTYFVAVSPEATTYSFVDGTFTLAPEDRPTTGNYALQVSVSGHSFGTGATDNQSYRFDRSEESGVLRSAPFDLSGYSADDLPRFYFDYFRSTSASDTIEMLISSDQQSTPVPLVGINGQTLGLQAPPVASPDSWRQAIASLGDFAGDTGVVIEFRYSTGAEDLDAEGLYLDNFIVGFAERGEMILGAQRGDAEFSGFAGLGGLSGEYQLEVRGASAYGASTTSGLEMDRVFDTNDRLTQAITLVAPLGSQIGNGDRFTLNDGATSVTFEFNSVAGFTPGVIRIPYAASDSATQVAQRLINAINSSIVQSSLKIKAAPASGNQSLTATDARVNLHGVVIGQFQEIQRVTDAPATLQSTPRPGGGRNIQLPAIRHDGYGDQNVQRIQGQFMVDSTSISHTRGVALWSEQPPRATDPRDGQGLSYLVAPPVGLTLAGAAIHFPNLNDSVLGGLQTGAVFQNNIIDQPGTVGIKVDGLTRPMIVTVASTGSDDLPLRVPAVNDGDTFTIDAGGTRVVFEFDDVGGAPTTAGGSGTVGGNGVRDGHIPIYFHHRAQSGNYNFQNNVITSLDAILVGMQQAINGSKLVTNNQLGLVRAYVAPSLLNSDGDGSGLPALYIEGATGFYSNRGIFGMQLAPVAEVPQPFVRIVNNTIYGSDGRESEFADSPTNEPNETIFDAIDTKLGRAHGAPYVRQGIIGDTNGSLPADRDVDMFKVELEVGDRLIVDIDTLPGGPATVLRLFDERGVPQEFVTGAGVVRSVSETGPLPTHLKRGSTAGSPAADAENNRDGFVDFTATRSGTYFVGVSSRGNDRYDALSLAGRTTGEGGTGQYTIAMEVLAPRDFVLMLQGGAGTGTRTGNLVGATFTITQIPDVRGNANFGAFGNQVTFEFTNNSGAAVLPNGNINVPLFDGVNGGYRTQEIMRAISSAINRTINGLPVVGNHVGGNGPEGRSGPLPRVQAIPLGGAAANNGDINRIGFGAIPGNTNLYSRTPGFGHDRRETGGGLTQQGVTSNGLSDGAGTSELFVQIYNAARIQLSPAARAGGLRVGPDLTENLFSDQSGQLIPEAGIMVMQGASPTIVNNVLMNLHQSIVADESAVGGFGRGAASNNFYKDQAIVMTGNVFQYDESRTSRMQLNFPFVTLANDISTNASIGPSNVSSATDDFNVIVGGNVQLLDNPAGGRFTPAPFSPLIDSALNSLPERDRFGALKQSLGIPISNILAPDRDHSGQLRADNNLEGSSGGLGSDVFKDRGALDRADFVGPTATLEFPRDNDAEGIDSDPTESFLQLTSGVYNEFRILLQDIGDSSDPFVGSGIDHNSVVVPAVDGLRASGANFALYENDRLLVEGVDYTFSYDTTRGVVTLRPLTGIWRSDRAYRIAVNNRDRMVLNAQGASSVADGDSFQVFSSDGGRLTLEYETGYELRIPDPLQVTVPSVGTATGGITDGTRFSITNEVGTPVFFEFDRDGVFLAGTQVIPFNLGDTPATIAQSTADAIQAAVDAGLLDVSPRVIGSRVIIGSEPGTQLDVGNTNLIPSARTLALRGSQAAAGLVIVSNGDTVTINAAGRTATFEFDTDGVVEGNNIPVPIEAGQTWDEARVTLQRAILDSPLRVEPVVFDEFLVLNLPLGGSVQVEATTIAPVAVSQTPGRGNTITFESPGVDPVTVVLNRTDVQPEVDEDGEEVEPLPEGIIVDLVRADTADELAARIAAAITSQPITGVDPQFVLPNPGGQVAIGGAEDLILTVSESSPIRVVGQPSVTGSSLLTFSGPLLLQVPITGGSLVPENSQFFLNDGQQTVVFEYVQDILNATNPEAIPIVFTTFDDQDTFGILTTAAINAAGLDIDATYDQGRISLGRLDDSQFGFPEPAEPLDPLAPVDPVIPAPLTPVRGTVADGEQIVIRQGNLPALRLEFEAALGGGGVESGFIPVVFQEDSTPEEIAQILAAVINNNRGLMEISATAIPGGRVQLDDTPLTEVDVSAAPTILLSGTPGGAFPVRINGAFGPNEVRAAIVAAINEANQRGLTILEAETLGGQTLFVDNAILIEGNDDHYFLRAVRDLAGNPLKPNRADGSTQFTILLPTVNLDFGDAPSALHGVPGRYPTLLVHDGARHVIGSGPILGTRVDADPDGQPSINADGDNTSIRVLGTTGTSFQVTPPPGTRGPEIVVSLDIPNDGDTLTIDTGVATATFEFDEDGLFNENHFAVSIGAGENFAAALQRAILESPLQIAELEVRGSALVLHADDEDGVLFISDSNPTGVFNSNFATPVTVTVTGAGVLEAWIDFNGDGDWDDPGEQVISASNPLAIFTDTGAPQTRTFMISMPPTLAPPNQPLTTYARFRISANGGLGPSGLALSGEVEDYLVRILPGTPPTVPFTERQYQVLEDNDLQAFDVDGVLTPSTNDDGLLVGVSHPEGKAFAIFPADVGTRPLTDDRGEGGELTVNPDGTFSFVPEPDYFGTLRFTYRVTDVHPSGDINLQLVNPTVVTVTINVLPVNDPPVQVDPSQPVIVEVDSQEDEPLTFTIDDLTDGLFVPGPPNESDQPLIIQTAGAMIAGEFVPFVTEQGGTLVIQQDGSVRYTPQPFFNSEDGRGPDRFIYFVADVPPAGQIQETAEDPGTVVINIQGVNNPPIARNDFFAVEENVPRALPLRNAGGTGILDNDSPGPAFEDDQEIDLITTDFPLTTLRGGTVTYNPNNGGSLFYTPPADFIGEDRFSYRILDDGVPPLEATGTVILTVTGDNKPAVFLGVNGVTGVSEISTVEAKATPKVLTYNLNTWFTDPEGDPLIFEAEFADKDENLAGMTVEVSGPTMTLTLPPFGFGEATLTVRAINDIPDGLTTTVPILVTIIDTPDPPMLIGGFPNDILEGQENETAVGDLSTVFFDPDRQPLTYRVIEPSNLGQSPLIESVTFVGDQILVVPRPFANGQQVLTIGASDGASEVSYTFTLDIKPVENPPVAQPDTYGVSVGGRLSVSDPAQGLLANDFDPDGDAIEAILVTQPSRGTLTQFRPDGTFVYQNNIGLMGQTDSFTYRVRDETGLFSSDVTVTINLTRSAYQNPLPGLQADVNADGFVSPVDALRIINLLNRRGSLSIPVRDLTTSPPDFVDVDGNGRVEPRDALEVINFLNRRGRVGAGQGEDAARFDAVLAGGGPLIENASLQDREERTAFDEPAAQQAPLLQGTSPHRIGVLELDDRIEAAVSGLADQRPTVDKAVSDSAVDEVLSELFPGFPATPS